MGHLALLLFSLATGWGDASSIYSPPDWHSSSTDYLKVKGCTLFARSDSGFAVARAIAVMKHAGIDMDAYKHDIPSFACSDGRATWIIMFQHVPLCVDCHFLVYVGDKDHYVEFHGGG